MKDMMDLQIPKPVDHGHDHLVFWPAACVHCGGDLRLCEDKFGPFRKCIACGRISPEGLGHEATAHATNGCEAFASSAAY